MPESGLPERLRALRFEKNLTQTDVAVRAMISNSALSQYESGKRMPGFPVLLRLAELYGVTTDYILGASDLRLVPGERKTLSEDQLIAFERLKSMDSRFFNVLLRATCLQEDDRKRLRHLMNVFIQDVLGVEQDRAEK